MATSSIFTNIKITDPEKINAFAAALEASAADPMPCPDTAMNTVLSDPDAIKELWYKRKKNL